jgi:hypothetical protein
VRHIAAAVVRDPARDRLAIETGAWLAASAGASSTMMRNEFCDFIPGWPLFRVAYPRNSGHHMEKHIETYSKLETFAFRKMLPPFAIVSSGNGRSGDCFPINAVPGGSDSIHFGSWTERVEILIADGLAEVGVRRRAGRYPR